MISTRLAMGIIAAALSTPLLAAQETSGHHGNWVTRWLPTGQNVIDTTNGNDMRDNRDSTISRNDVPVNQTTLPQGNQAHTGRSGSDAAMNRSNANEPKMTNAGTGTTALPATAVSTAGAGTVAANPEADTSVATESASSQSGTTAAQDGEVTTRNTGGVDAVHDRVNHDGDSESAGDTGTVSAGRDGEPAGQ